MICAPYGLAATIKAGWLAPPASPAETSREALLTTEAVEASFIPASAKSQLTCKGGEDSYHLDSA